MSWDHRKEAALVSEVRASRGVPDWQEVAANFNLKFAPEKFNWDQVILPPSPIAALSTAL